MSKLLTVLKNLALWIRDAEPATIVGGIGSVLGALVMLQVITPEDQEAFWRSIGGVVEGLSLIAVRASVYSRKTVEKLSGLRDVIPPVSPTSPRP